MENSEPPNRPPLSVLPHQEMKAVVITSPGGPEVLQVQEVENPRIGDDEVLIKIEATALNRADTLQRKGSYPPPQGASPYPGLECSGTVESVGKNVTRWTVGDQVEISICYNFFHFSRFCKFFRKVWRLVKDHPKLWSRWTTILLCRLCSPLCLLGHWVGVKSFLCDGLLGGPG